MWKSRIISNFDAKVIDFFYNNFVKFKRLLYRKLVYLLLKWIFVQMNMAYSYIDFQLFDQFNANARQRGRMLQFQNVQYGYVRVEPRHGVDYILDIVLWFVHIWASCILITKIECEILMNRIRILWIVKSCSKIALYLFYFTYQTCDYESFLTFYLSKIYDCTYIEAL